MAYRMVARDTIEEKVMALKARKAGCSAASSTAVSSAPPSSPPPTSVTC
ncbi:hypothetical protein [Micromonospora yangpuensis]|nr:hypothetical protein [Micromonospora yangpuensis]